MKSVRLILEPLAVEGQTVTVAAELRHPDGPRQRLWWRLPAQWQDAVTPWADPFIVAFLILLMQWRRPVEVEGKASPYLLANLERFMALIHIWSEGQYEPVTIRAAEEIECPAPSEPGQTITTFSAGLDSCYTVYRHRRNLLERRNQNITAGIVMHGFDIWLDERNAAGMYQGLLDGCRTMLDSVGVQTIPVTTNYHELPIVWGHSLVNHLVGASRLFAGRFDSALVANGVTYARLGVRWGVHPQPLSYLDSRHFHVADDGAEASRLEKIALVAQWPEAMRHLRVCFGNAGSHTNCCRCEKCIRTILSFRAAGVERPPSLPADVTNRQIRRVRFHEEQRPFQWQEIADSAAQHGLAHVGWVRAIRAAIRYNRRHRFWSRCKRPFIPWRNHLRRLFRGSAQSRRERAAGAVNPPQ